MKTSEETVVVKGAARMIARALNAPAMPHVKVEVRRRLIPASRAAAGFAAEARMARPVLVRARNHASARQSGGINTRISTCSLRMKRPPSFQACSNGVGYARTEVGAGRMAWQNSRSWAIAMVATRSITRGASASRRTTTTSISTPTSPPRATHNGSATQ